MFFYRESLEAVKTPIPYRDSHTVYRILILGDQRGRYVDAKSEEHQQCTSSNMVCFLIER